MKKKINLFEFCVKSLVVIIVMVAGLSIPLIGCSRFAAITGAHTKEATSQAKRWAENLGIKVKAIDCVGGDSDDDGYVSCTVSEEKGDGEVRLHMIECAGAFNLSQGCRAPKVQLLRHQE